ncbi:MAG TPA: MarR family transcriptional regulator [Micrococcaceae bacterium]
MSVKDQTLVELVNEVFRLFRSLKSMSIHQTPAAQPGLAHVGILGLLSRLGECRATEVAAQLGVGPSALSRQLADLDSQGLVERRPDPQDGRATLLHVSDAGAAQLSAITQRRAARMREHLQGWTEEEAQQTLAAVERLAAAFREPLADGPTDCLRQAGDGGRQKFRPQDKAADKVERGAVALH